LVPDIRIPESSSIEAIKPGTHEVKIVEAGRMSSKGPTSPPRIETIKSEFERIPDVKAPEHMSIENDGHKAVYPTKILASEYEQSSEAPLTSSSSSTESYKVEPPTFPSLSVSTTQETKPFRVFTTRSPVPSEIPYSKTILPVSSKIPILPPDHSTSAPPAPPQIELSSSTTPEQEVTHSQSISTQGTPTLLNFGMTTIHFAKELFYPVLSTTWVIKEDISRFSFTSILHLSLCLCVKEHGSIASFQFSKPVSMHAIIVDE
jgi:hypothetical protein